MVCHATGCKDFLWSLSLHRNLLFARSNSSKVFSGIRQVFITCAGMTAITDYINNNLAAQDSSFVFHHAKRAYTLSTTYPNCWLLTCPWNRSTPRYLPRSCVDGIPKLTVIVCTKFKGVFGEYHILDFLPFTLWPDSLQKAQRIPCITAAWFTEASPNSRRSSMKNKCDTANLLLPNRHGFHIQLPQPHVFSCRGPSYKGQTNKEKGITLS